MVIGPYVKNAFENDNRTVKHEHIEKVMDKFKERYSIQNCDRNDSKFESSIKIIDFLERECEESAYEKFI
jgi:hypothetical protein